MTQQNQATTETVLNGVNADRVMELAGKIQNSNDYGQFCFRANNVWADGSRNRSSIQQFFAGGKEDHSRVDALTVDADQPEFLGGNNTAPNPVEYILHSLGSCLTTTLAYHAAVQGIKIDGIESDYEGDLDARGFFGISEEVNKGYTRIRANMRVKSEADVEKLTELAMFSPVFEMLSRSLPVEFSLTTH